MSLFPSISILAISPSCLLCQEVPGYRGDGDRSGVAGKQFHANLSRLAAFAEIVERMSNDPSARFTARKGKLQLTIYDFGFDCSFQYGGEGDATNHVGENILFRFEGQEGTRASGEGLCASSEHYFNANSPDDWVTGVRTFKKVIEARIIH